MISIGMRSGNQTVEGLILQSMRTLEDPWTRPYLYGGSAGGCQRENFLSAQVHPLGQIQNMTTPQSYFYMAIGDGIEKAIVNGLTKADRLFGDNVYLPVSTPLVRGKMDIVFVDQNDKIALGEIKSCGTLPNEPKSGHLAQATTYASISGHDNVYLIYVSRNVIEKGGNVAIKSFRVDTSEHTLRANMKIIVESAKAIESNYIPAIPSHMKKSMCHFCSYKDTFCWGEGASDGKFKRLPDSLRDEYVIELNSTLETLYANRQRRFKEHLDFLWDQERVKSSPFLQQALSKKLEELIQHD